MVSNTLKYEVRRLDGTAESIIRVVDLLLNQFKENPVIPETVTYGFFEEYMKCICNWTGEGNAIEMQKTYEGIVVLIQGDDELIAPFTGEGNCKKRFAANLSSLQMFIEVYLRSDLECKRNQITK